MFSISLSWVEFNARFLFDIKLFVIQGFFQFSFSRSVRKFPTRPHSEKFLFPQKSTTVLKLSISRQNRIIRIYLSRSIVQLKYIYHSLKRVYCLSGEFSTSKERNSIGFHVSTEMDHQKLFHSNGLLLCQFLPPFSMMLDFNWCNFKNRSIVAPLSNPMFSLMFSRFPTGANAVLKFRLIAVVTDQLGTSLRRVMGGYTLSTKHRHLQTKSFYCIFDKIGDFPC